MARTPRPSSAIATAIAALVAATAGAAPPEATTITTRGAISAIALDGRRLAYALRAPAGCSTVRVRDLRSGRDAIVSGKGTCAADSTSTGAGIREVSVAGPRVAWIVNLGGNTESTDILFGATQGVVGEHRIAAASRRGDVDGRLRGGWLGNLAADGDLVALNRWTTTERGLAGATIRRLARGGIPPVHLGADALRVVAVDAGRIAVLADDGVVTVRRVSGTLVATLAPGAPAREAALEGDVAVLLEPRRLNLVQIATGETIGSFAVPAGARGLAVHGDVATLVVGRSVVAVGLHTGRVAVVALAPRAIVDTALDEGGLAVAYNRTTGVRGAGTLVVVPLAVVRARVA